MSDDPNDCARAPENCPCLYSCCHPPAEDFTKIKCCEQGYCFQIMKYDKTVIK